MPIHPQSAVVEQRFPKLAEGDFNTGMRLVTSEGRIYVGADAAYQVLRRLGGWRWIAWIYRVPIIHAVTRAAYAWIASHRHALGGDCEDGACSQR